LGGGDVAGRLGCGVVDYRGVGLFDYLGDLFMNGAGERMTSRIRSDVFGYVERLPMAFHDRQTIGELTSRVVSDTSRIEQPVGFVQPT